MEDVEPGRRQLLADGWFRAGLGLWVTTALVVAVKALINPRRHTIFPLLVGGARHWWARLPLYDEYPGINDVFRYSPTCALAFSPFAPLPNRYGGALWCLVNLGVLAAGLIVAARDVLPGRWPPWRVGALLALAWVGAVRPAWNSQSNPLVIGLILLGASAIARDRPWWAATLLAIPVFLKLSPIAIATLLIALRPRALGWRFAVAMAVGALLPFATAPPSFVLGQYESWLASLSRHSATRWPAFRDAWTLWRLTGYPVNIPAYRATQGAAGLATLAWCLAMRRQLVGIKAQLTATLAMGTAYLLAFGPAVEYATYVILSPMVSWAVLAATEHRAGRTWVTVAFLLTMLAGADLVERTIRGWTPLAPAALPAGSLLFAGWVVVYARRLTAEPRPAAGGIRAGRC